MLTKKKQGGENELASMPTARFSFQSEVIDSKIYTVGSSWNSDYEIIAPTEVYDPSTNKWKKLASIPTARFAFQTAVIGDKIYVIGSENLDNMQLVSSTEVYDPSTNTWTTLASMSTARATLQTEVVDDKIYAIGGFDTYNLNLDNQLLSAEVYDPSTDKWTTLASMSTKRYLFHTEVIDKVIYAIGGTNDPSMESYAVPANATK